MIERNIHELQTTIKSLSTSISTMQQRHEEQQKQQQYDQLHDKRIPTTSSIQTITELEHEVQTLKDNLKERIETEQRLIGVLHDQWNAIEQRLCSCESDTKTLFAAHETLAKHLTKRLDSACSKVDMQQKTLQLEHSISECNKKTKRMEGLHKRVDEMVKDLTVTKKRAELAAQFIHWFEEHNNVQS